jgi:hypothetical protein
MLKADYPNLNDEQLPTNVSVLEMDMKTFQKICPRPFIVDEVTVTPSIKIYRLQAKHINSTLKKLLCTIKKKTLN